MKKFAVIGDPIEHSLSPVMHNAAFKELSLDCSYEAVEVESGTLATELPKLAKEYAGINVTIPHKEDIIPLLDKVEVGAGRIGAVNCVDFKDGSIGYNTDITGSMQALKDVVGSLEGKKIMILGAGGAARAIAFGCIREGAKIGICNRTADKAEELASQLPAGRASAVGMAFIRDASIIINATSVGMSPESGESPIEASRIREGVVVMDIVYNPLKTMLLHYAEKAGAICIDGVDMLVNQGADSLKIWLDVDAPRDVMKEAVIKALR
jgi:shikimate dehydrogenase